MKRVSLSVPIDRSMQRRCIAGLRDATLRAVTCLFAVLTTLVAHEAAAQASACLRGVNIAGAEFGGADAVYGQDYIYPSDATLDWAAAQKMTTIRLPFRWERLQPELFADFDPAELARLQVTVQAANSRGLIVILDLHNYAEYKGTRVGTDPVSNEAFADFWHRLTPFFAGNEQVVFGLMNEPDGVTAKVWFDAAQSGLNAIRGAGSRQLVLVPGNIWTGASHWFDPQEGGSNADLLKNISDPVNNFAFEVHQYMDADYSGTNRTCPRSQDAIEALKAVAGWLKQHGFTGFVGEFGGTSSPDCLRGLSDMAKYLNSNSDVWIGWTAWAAGDWWGNYPLSLQPEDGTERPQMKVLAPYIAPQGNTERCGPVTD